MNNTLFLLKHTKIQTSTKIIIYGQILDMITTAFFLTLGIEEGNKTVLVLGWPISITIKILSTFLFCFFIQYVKSINYNNSFINSTVLLTIISSIAVPIWNIILILSVLI